MVDSCVSSVTETGRKVERGNGEKSVEKIVGLLILFIFFFQLDCTLTQYVGNGPRAGEKALRATCPAGDRWDHSGPREQFALWLQSHACS